jgi:hypothetical protein
MKTSTALAAAVALALVSGLAGCDRILEAARQASEQGQSGTAPASADPAAPAEAPAVPEVETGTVSVFDLNVGDCLNGNAQGVVGTMDRVTCDQPHVFEVYHAFDIAGNVFPGEQSVTQQAETGCIAAFEGYVGKDYQQSALFLNTLWPTADSWVQQNDREVLCMLHNQDMSPRTGSARGTGI